MHSGKMKKIRATIEPCPRCENKICEMLVDQTPNQGTEVFVKVTCIECQYSTGWGATKVVDHIWQTGMAKGILEMEDIKREHSRSQ